MMLRDGSTVSDARLNRLVEFDERSLRYGVRQRLNTDQLKPTTKLWLLPPKTTVLDQGQEGACAGFAITNELLYTPTPIAGLDARFAHDAIYWGAQKIDPWPGGSYPGASPVYEGTSVLSAIKATQRLGYYGEYCWAFGEDDLVLALALGPVVLGLNWRDGMCEPDSRGYVRPTGQIQGGHCVLCVGVNLRSGYYTLHNSWGSTWGDKGRCRITRSDMDTLLSDSGEACVIVQRFRPAR